MYLYKTKKVEGFSAEEYEMIDQYVTNSIKEATDIALVDLDAVTGIVGANTLKDAVEKRGEFVRWYSIFTEVGYWRKANQIHGWFVDYVQNGVDECQLSIVTQEQLQTLLDFARSVKQNKERAHELLPTRGGFFFGNTDYNEWYEGDINGTIQILTELFHTTDFDQEVIFYRSSW